MAEPVSPAQLDLLLSDEAVPVMHRALWAVLWDGELRLDDLLSVDVRDVDLDARTVAVDYPAKRVGPVTAPLGQRAAGLVRHAIGDRTDGPLFAGDSGDPLRHATVVDWARSVGASIHGFRLGGQLARREGEPNG